ncbi:class D sortase [Rossellomorea aquimaris]|uniref:class D sortase n=1 Tax=Rossellomorea aquimaris TaxID=189382 RepID=UPI001CD3BEE5|nr:class D sortase [Rossellomorea aquimaris]MCA1055137.1 class D sortase [Rossellomorea aquimaris]
MRSNLLTILSIFLLVGGSSLLGYSTLQLLGQEVQAKKSLLDAKAIVKPDIDIIGNKENELTYSFSQDDTIGILTIPKLNKELPIIEGTDEEELEKGVGHHPKTKLPGQNDRIFLAGHRDTVFKQMGKIEKGDQLLLEMKSGTYRYEVFETVIVKETDVSVLQPTTPEEILTLSTCYPFEYLSSTEERYIINARRIN